MKKRPSTSATSRRGLTLHCSLLLLAVASLCVVHSSRGQQHPLPAPLGGKEHVIRRLELKETSIVDAARLIAEMSGLQQFPVKWP